MKVMDLSCSQLLLNGLDRIVFLMSSLKGNILVAVMVSRCLCSDTNILRNKNIVCILFFPTQNLGLKP